MAYNECEYDLECARQRIKELEAKHSDLQQEVDDNWVPRHFFERAQKEGDELRCCLQIVMNIYNHVIAVDERKKHILVPFDKMEPVQ